MRQWGDVPGISIINPTSLKPTPVFNLKLPSSTWVGTLVSVEELRDNVSDCYVHTPRRTQYLAPLLHCYFSAFPHSSNWYLFDSLELRESMWGWTLFPTKRKMGHEKASVFGRVPQSPWLLWWLRTVKHLPTMWETWARSLGREDPLEKEMATHSRILAWKIPWAEDPGRLQSMGSQRVEHDWETSLTEPCWVSKMLRT